MKTSPIEFISVGTELVGQSDAIDSATNGLPTLTIAKGDRVIIQGKDKVRKRKQFFVTNFSAEAGDILFVCDLSGNVIFGIFSRETKTVETDAPFMLRANDTIAYAIGESYLPFGYGEGTA